MARRRLNPPWIPGFWPLLTFLLLIFSVGVYFYVLSKCTVFERRSAKTVAAAVK